ncbi:MAG: oligosaccharide flippase family protein [Lewinellaceae bacterium]|nr:oligosaccharide flippase family protein [Lewinellaceae bacterium]
MLKQRFVIQFGSQFGIKILGMIAGLIVARVAGPEVVGVIAFGTAYISIWGFITGLFGTGHIKMISEGKDFGNCMTTYTWLQGASLFLYIVFVLGFFSYQKFFLTNAFESRTHEIVILILLLANIIDQALNFGNSTFTAKLEMTKANYPLVLKAVIFHLSRIVIVFLGLRAIGLATANLISALLALPLAWRFIKKIDFGRFNKDLFKEHIRYSIPIFLIVIINAVMENADKLLLNYYTDTKELGYYSAAFSIGGVVLLVSNTIGNIFFPLFSGLIARKDWQAVNQKIDNFQNFIVLFIFPLICLLIIIGTPFLITLIGEKYYPSVLPFKILLFATYLSIVGIPYGNIINGMGRFYINVLINLICLAVFVASIFFLVNPAYLGLGATGIAINLVVINAVRNILYWMFSFRMGEMKFQVSVFLPYLTIGMVSAIFLWLSPTFLEWSSLWWLIMSPVYIAIVYYAMYQFGFIGRKNIEQLLDVMNLKKLRDYINFELRDDK